MTNTLIRGATLIAGNGAPPVPDSGVLIAGDRIQTAGPLAAVMQHPDASDATVIEAAGKWIIPGLIDSHIHATLTGVDSMPVFLACGVTTVRDTGGPLDVMADIRGAIDSGAVASPRFIFCGPLIDGELPSFPTGVLPIIESTANPAAAADLAQQCIDSGAGSIKLYFRLGREALAAAIQRVAGRVPVTGHLGRTRASEAVAEGINSFEHAIITLYNDVVADADRFDARTSNMGDHNFWLGLFRGWSRADLEAPGAQELLQSMRARDVTLDATLDITHSGLGTPPPPADDPRLKYAHKELAAGWAFLRQNARTPSDEDRGIAARGHAMCDDFVRRYHDLGGRVTAGTDVGAVPFIVPGFSLHDEIGMLVRAGLSTSAALNAATIDAATALRIADETGSIEPGKCADLVILDADPLADIRNLGRVHTVVRAGELHDPQSLLATAAS